MEYKLSQNYIQAILAVQTVSNRRKTYREILHELQ
jgi:hypothetical protein